MTRTALITGITGQDGAYLAKLLLEKGYHVFGMYRRLSTPNFWRLQHLNIFEKVSLVPGDLMDQGSLVEAIKASSPDEIYHMAAQSFVAASFDQPTSTTEVTGLGVTRLLEAVRMLDRSIKIYQASTSELFGDGHTATLSEDSVKRPASPYAAAKLYGYWMTRIYREAYGMFVSNGILFNHESPLRGLEFVTRKISNGVARIALGLQHDLVLGNLDAERDWGYAPDYVEAIWLTLQQQRPDDYVVATNESHSVREFVELAFHIVNLPSEKHVRVDKAFCRPLDVAALTGDYSKAKRCLGWEPAVKFEELVEIMVKTDLRRWERSLHGEQFPWDAPYYPGDANVVSRV